MKQYLFVIVGIITVVVLMAAGGQIGGNPLAGVGGAVTSVFGRTGVVVATPGDYAVAQVTGAAPIASPTFTGTATTPTLNVTTTWQNNGTAVQPVLRGVFTVASGGTATSENLTVTGINSASPSRCVFSAASATAATNIAAIYISAVTTNTITFTHTAASANTDLYNVVCAIN